MGASFARLARLIDWQRDPLQAMDPMRLDAFRGTWILDRTIEDVRAARTGGFEGRATFRPVAGGLLYCEEGMLDLGQGRFAASRSYRWVDGGAGTIELRFEDGRFFHRFYADEAMPSAVHDCGEDQYRVRYDFRRWPRWTAEWRVRGPRKDYGMVSRYRPAGQGGENAA